jgi:polyhydroxybutyrate depolymerase
MTSIVSSNRFKTIGIAFAAILAGALVSLDPSPADATCASNTLSAGDSTISISFGGRTRSYMLHVPASFNGSKAVPLVIDMHGFTSTANAQSGVSGFKQVSDQQGFIVAWPSGLNNSWNAFGCCGNSLNRNVDDVGFIRAVVADVIRRGKIDESRVYATGLSNGGSMSHRLACQAADLFASTVPVSFTLNHTRAQCTPSRPITVFHFHGLNDTTVNFNGGTFESAPNSFADWQAIDGCTAGLTTVNFNATDRCDSATTCSAGVKPTLCRLSGTHVLYNTQTTVNIADFAWKNGMLPFTTPGKPVGCP